MVSRCILLLSLALTAIVIPNNGKGFPENFEGISKRLFSSNIIDYFSDNRINECVYAKCFGENSELNPVEILQKLKDKSSMICLKKSYDDCVYREKVPPQCGELK